MVTRAAGLVVFRFLGGSIEYLLLQTSYGSNHWTPPKGHVDPGESDWITAIRETNEEAGLSEADLEMYKDVSSTLEYTVNGKPKAVVYWLARLKDPLKTITLSHEHIDLRWLPLDETKALSGFENMHKTFEEFHEHAKKLCTTL